MLSMFYHIDIIPGILWGAFFEGYTNFTDFVDFWDFHKNVLPKISEYSIMTRIAEDHHFPNL